MKQFDFTPNDDNDGYQRPDLVEFWNPWIALGMYSYSGGVDQDAINVLKGIRDKRNSFSIGERYGMSDQHVELFQYIFCNAGWCEYGVSPRGCWFSTEYGPDFGANMLEKWAEYYYHTWGQLPA